MPMRQTGQEINPCGGQQMTHHHIKNTPKNSEPLAENPEHKTTEMPRFMVKNEKQGLQLKTLHFEDKSVTYHRYPTTIYCAPMRT